MLNQLKADLEKLADPARAKSSQWYFKTGPGEYGEGDVFAGLTAGDMHKLAKKYKAIKLDKIQDLLKSEIHEHRFIALEILTHQYKNNPLETFEFYLKNTSCINNWDLVDSSAPKIVGEYLLDKDRAVLYELARSASLWDRRIAIISTFAFIRSNDFEDALKLAEILLPNKHDLIHKAVGWVLREIWKKDAATAEEFIKKHYAELPRTTLRYAIERMEESKRKRFLKRKFN